MSPSAGTDSIERTAAPLQVPQSTSVVAADQRKIHIAVSKVSKIYRSARAPVVALKDVSLDISTGQFVSILGPSGCGKSTLLKCIAGLETLSAGQIDVEGEVVLRPPKGLGVVFQRDVLFDWRTAVDNVLITAEFLRLPRRNFIDRAHRLLKTYGLEGYEHRYPWEMSGGMRQRVAICRAMLCNPSLLLMDEPFGALDALTRDELNLELQDRWLADQKTIVFITHGITEAAFLSDRVVIMGRNPGHIVADINIELPRPRTISIRGTPDFARYTDLIQQIMIDTGILTAHS